MPQKNMCIAAPGNMQEKIVCYRLFCWNSEEVLLRKSEDFLE